MKTINQAVEELERLVNAELPRYDIPYKQGKSIRIGKTIVRKSQRHGYIVIDVEDNATVTTAFSKHGAIAIAKAYNEGKSYKEYLHLDKTVEKHFNDSVFYTHNISRSNDPFRIDVLQDRLDISQDIIECTTDRLENFILTFQR